MHRIKAGQWKWRNYFGDVMLSQNSNEIEAEILWAIKKQDHDNTSINEWKYTKKLDQDDCVYNELEVDPVEIE